jgi:peptidoglycan endopeptidase LytE
MLPMMQAPNAVHHQTLDAALRLRIVRIARSFLGTPYRWAGASRGGVDCSGLVYAVYRRVHIQLEHSSYALWDDLRHVHRPRLGDIVFFGPRSGPSHVGIYVGHDRFIHAPSTGLTVRYGHLRGPWRHPGYIGAARALKL